MGFFYLLVDLFKYYLYCLSLQQHNRDRNMTNTNQVRQAIGHQLLDALHQCNLADVEPDTTYPESCLANDINSKCSRQHEAYGYLSDALTSLGFNRAREVYASEGDVDRGHDEIDHQYQGVAA